MKKTEIVSILILGAVFILERKVIDKRKLR